MSPKNNMTPFWSPILLVNNKLARFLSKFSSFHSTVFFSFFRIIDLFLKIIKINQKNFKIYMSHANEIYSSIFAKKLANGLKHRTFIFFAKSEKENMISRSNHDSFGAEMNICEFSIDKKLTINLFTEKNLNYDILWNFLIHKNRDHFSSYKILGFFLNNFLPKKNKIWRLSLFQFFHTPDHKKKKYLSRISTSVIFKKKQTIIFFIESIFEFRTDKIYKKGICKKRKTNWLKFNPLEQKLLLKNSKISDVVKKNLYIKKIDFFKKNIFFLHVTISLFKENGFLKLKSFFIGNGFSVQNIFDEGTPFSQFSLNFLEIEGLNILDKYISDCFVPLCRILNLESLNLDTFLLRGTNTRNFWEKKNLFLFEKYKIVFFLSSNLAFFFFGESRTIVMGSSWNKNTFQLKDQSIKKQFEIFNFKRHQTYLKIRKNNLFHNSLKVLFSGQQNSYSHFT